MTDSFTREEGNQFIIDCHFDLDTVKSKVGDNPDLVHTYNTETIESPIGAAGHMGRPDIAEFLLANGAELELACAAMMGNKEYVQSKLEENPALANSGGAHNIPVAFHAAISGDTELMQMLWDAGAEEAVKRSLFGAFAFRNNVEIVKWLLAHGASKEGLDNKGRTMVELAEANEYKEIASLLK